MLRAVRLTWWLACIAPGLAANLGQPVHIENMSGIGGIAGVSRVAKAPPDGYHLVVGNVGTHAQNQFLFPIRHTMPQLSLCPPRFSSIRPCCW